MTQETENPGKSADYPKYNSSIFKISFSEMVRYMTAHFAETTCPQCLKDEGWSMDMEGDNPEAEGYDIMRVYRLVHADNGKIFKPLIIMSCNACGSIRTMMADRVTDWLKANQEEKKMSSDWGRKIVQIRPDVTSATGPSLDANAKLDHSKKMNDETSYRHEMHLRDEQLRREIDLRGESFRAEQAIRDKALDDRLGRMEDSVSSATKEIKDFKLWMAGIGVAVVLAIMGANYTLIGSAQGIFDGGKVALQSQQRIEKLIEESQAQAKENREILEALKTQVPPPSSPQK